MLGMMLAAIVIAHPAECSTSLIYSCEILFMRVADWDA